MKTLLPTFILLLITDICFSQTKVEYQVGAEAAATSNRTIPFWMRSNQHGNFAPAGASTSMTAKITKPYDPNKRYDWAAGLDSRFNIARESNVVLLEAYGKIKVGVLQFQAGRTKGVMGLNGDTSLSSGNFAVSGNALGIPKLEISLPDYYTIPGLAGLLSIKGSFSHGWVGKMDVKDTIAYSTNPTVSLIQEARVLLHQKSLYARFGMPKWKIKFYGGFSHQVLWGDEKKIYGEYYKLSKLQTLYYVTTGKAYGNNVHIPNSKIGNHLGSIDLGVEYDFSNLKVLLYRQNFYDVGALSKLANIRDGLNGISFTNKLNRKSHSSFFWKKILLEFLYTKNQAGELNSKYTKSGDEDYYNNYFYTQGWSYNKVGIGTPFISPKESVRKGLVSDPRDYFINNRVVAFHGGIETLYKDWLFVTKLSYSKNYGTYGTSPIGHSLGNLRIWPKYGIFDRVNQFSGSIEANRNLVNNFVIGGLVAFDTGKLLLNSSGIRIRIAKRF